MAMDVRDVLFWAAEAKRKGLVRQLRAYNAALMPRREPKTNEREMTRLQTQLREIDEADEIAETERENAKVMAEKNARLRARQKRKREMGATAAVKRKPRPPAGARTLKAKV